MTRFTRVLTPPAKPLLVYDGDCGFCCFWVRRWQRATGIEVDYLPFQDSRVARQFPELPRTQFQAAVQLIDREGRVYGGAEAVCRLLAYRSNGAWWLWLYQKVPGLSAMAERGYRMIARWRGGRSAQDPFACRKD
jgi:predicted DCC family thiol-disulfide oxidoreductase YuxK